MLLRNSQNKFIMQIEVTNFSVAIKLIIEQNPDSLDTDKPLFCETQYPQISTSTTANSRK